MAQYFLLHPNTAAVAQASGNTIYVAANWINGMSALDQEALLLHEVLHNITGKIDYDLQLALNISTSAASQNIGDTFKKDCLQ
jgi:hypothetical protein